MPLFKNNVSRSAHEHSTLSKDAMTMHVVVQQPLTEHHGGSITCQPIGVSPIQFSWSGTTENIVFDKSNSHAEHVPVGTYTITASDALNRTAQVNVDVTPVVDTPLYVSEYSVRHASSSVARDARVEALGYNLDSWSTYLWSNGVQTKTPVLCDVACGTYVVVAIANAENVIPTFVHDAEPAQVRAYSSF